MPGPRDPRAHELAGIEAGALAGLLLVDGDPLEDTSILTAPEENLALITKDGTNHRSTIQQ